MVYQWTKITTTEKIHPAQGKNVRRTLVFGADGHECISPCYDLM
jgi:hypothetical protein